MFRQYSLTLQIEPVRRGFAGVTWVVRNAVKLFEKEEKEYSAKELREALKTGDIAGLLK